VDLVVQPEETGQGQRPTGSTWGNKGKRPRVDVVEPKGGLLVGLV